MFLLASSVEGLVTWFLFLFDFQMRIYPTELMSLHSSIDQNMEQVELHIFHWDYRRDQTNGSTSTNNKMAVDSLIMGFSVHVNLLIFYLEIHSFFEDTTVNTE